MKYKYSMIHLAVDTKYRSLASVWFNPQFPPCWRPRGSVVAGAACRDYDPTLASLHCTCPLLATTFTLDWTCFQKLVPVVLGLQHTLYLCWHLLKLLFCCFKRAAQLRTILVFNKRVKSNNMCVN